MNNKKCPKCGFINFLTAEACRKCETDLGTVGAPEPVYSGQHAPMGTYQAPNESTDGGPEPAHSGQYSPMGTYQRPYYQVTPPPKGFPIFKLLACVFGGLILVSAVTVVVGVALLKKSSRIAWQEFRAPHGSLIVMMPTEPRTIEPIVTPMAIGEVTNHGYSASVMGQGSALYCVVDFPINLSAAMSNSQISYDKMLNEEVNNLIARTNSTLVSKRSITFNGNPGMEFEVRPPGNLRLRAARGYGKVLFIQDQEYLLLVTASEDSDLFNDRDKFLNPLAKY